MPAGQFSKDPVVDKALRHSVRDGMAYSVQVGAGETYFSAFALFLRATAPQVALVSTLPLLLASFAQIFSAWIGNYVGRRRLVILGCALQALLWLPILLVPVLFSGYAIPALLVLLVLYHSANNLVRTAMDEHHARPRVGARRGRYFAHRTRLTTITTFGSLVAVRPPPPRVRHRKAAPTSVSSLIFLIAFVARTISVYHLTFLHEPPADDDGARHAHRALVAQPAVDGRDRFLGLRRPHERGRRHLVAVLHGVHAARPRA